jgi:hypothetical protein
MRTEVKCDTTVIEVKRDVVDLTYLPDDSFTLPIASTLYMDLSIE